ncbi:MAG: BPSS1780 family membrane protein [Stenotrophobium sp.]
MTAYYVAVNGERTGPYTLEQIGAACGSGQIGRQTLMWREGLSQWLSAEQVLQGSGIVFADAVPPPVPGAVATTAAPAAETKTEKADFHFAVPALQAPPGRGAAWIGEGWTLFKAAPGHWILVLLIWIGIQCALSVVPLFGSLAGLLLGPAFSVGLLAFAHGMANGEAADIGKFFAGFKDKFAPLLVLALIYFGLMCAVILAGVILAIVMLGGSSFLHTANPELAIRAALTGADALTFVLVFLLVFAALLLVNTAYWFAPGLVFFAGQHAGAAMKQSFAACLRNWLPLLVFSLIGLLLGILGAIPLGLGLLVVVPVLVAGNYFSFRDFFGRQGPGR